MIVLFCTAGVVLTLYWIFYLSALWRRDRPVSAEQPPVSVVICARTATEGIVDHLPNILKQDYPIYEVIVVNDGPDQTLHSRLREIGSTKLKEISFDSSQKKIAGKKEPLHAGIEAARHDLLLLTDADCLPASDQWIRHMVARLGSAKQIVLGVAPFFKTGSLVNAFARFEGLLTAIQYLAYAGARIPYMGVGRNMMYDRRLYRAADGFAAHTDLASGDDDLFINQVATSQNTAVCTAPGSFVYSASQSSWKTFFGQKRRHLSTGTRYRPLHQFWLGMFSASLIGYAALLLPVCLSGSPWIMLWTVLLVIRWAIAFVLFSRLREMKLALFFPLLEIFYACYLLVMAPALFKNPKAWSPS